MQPLSAPDPALGQGIASAAREASTTAFHLAMLVGAALFASGAAMNWVGMPSLARTREDIDADDATEAETAR